MKLNKKKVFSLALVALLIATISFGTLAWFSDSDETTNTFYVATSEDDSADDIFSVNVYEDVDTDNDGTLEKEDDEGAEFSDILPGQKIVKKPYVENTGRYDQWVRLTITFESQDAWYRVNGGKPIDLLTLDPDFNSNWVGDSYSAENGAYTYVYYSRNPLGA
ncbi:MAG: hypothetical protein J6V25_08375 [Oscillospiraceae bacterium]|nr:hypothetical protein [Oscillospiraceae bacterium]